MNMAKSEIDLQKVTYLPCFAEQFLALQTVTMWYCLLLLLGSVHMVLPGPFQRGSITPEKKVPQLLDLIAIIKALAFIR